MVPPPKPLGSWITIDTENNLNEQTYDPRNGMVRDNYLGRLRPPLPKATREFLHSSFQKKKEMTGVDYPTSVQEFLNSVPPKGFATKKEIQGWAKYLIEYHKSTELS